jgi:hypothetical protein
MRESELREGDLIDVKQSLSRRKAAATRGGDRDSWAAFYKDAFAHAYQEAAGFVNLQRLSHRSDRDEINPLSRNKEATYGLQDV